MEVDLVIDVGLMGGQLSCALIQKQGKEVMIILGNDIAYLVFF